MTRIRKPIPKNQAEIVQSAINPYLSQQGKPISQNVFTHRDNRGLNTTRKNDKTKDISIGLQDIDNAIKYYFDTVIKPTVVQDGNVINVPIMYGSPERWKSVQAEGYYRDTNGKLVLPLIMYKRENIEKNRGLGNKIDGNLASLFQVFETRYNAKNQYDNFSVLTNRIPSKQYYVSVVPDYVIVTYSVSILTSYVEQNNKILEGIEFAADSYWGDPNRWQFRTMIDSFATTNIINTGEDRVATTTITLKTYGYLIPDTVNQHLADTNIHYSPAQVIFGIEAVGDTNETFNAGSQIAASQAQGQTSFVGGGNNVLISNVTIDPGSAGDLNYLNANVSKTADTITVPNIAIFTGVSLLQPPVGSSLPPTSVDSFYYYINGQNISPDLVTLVEAGGDVTLTFNTSSLGYSLESIDEVIAIGKFA